MWMLCSRASVRRQKGGDAIERGVAEYLRQIDEMGGTLRAIERGYIQNEIQNAAYDYQRAVERGDRIVVGVNRFQKEGERPPATFRVAPALEQAQVERLRQVRASRSASTVSEKLDALEQTARGEANLMPPIVDAAEAHATLGEISDRLRAVFGEHREG